MDHNTRFEYSLVLEAEVKTEYLWFERCKSFVNGTEQTRIMVQVTY